MNSIESLSPSEHSQVMVYKYKGDDGLLIAWSHGRMAWYRVDTRKYIYIGAYSYWVPA